MGAFIKPERAFFTWVSDDDRLRSEERVGEPFIKPNAAFFTLPGADCGAQPSEESRFRLDERRFAEKGAA